MLPFLIIGGVGVVLLLISLILGDIFDAMEIGDGAISGTGIGIAAVVFGASGALTTNAGLDTVWAYVLAAVIAVIAYILTIVVIRNLSRSSDGTPASAVGLSGVATSTITAASGEVSLDGPHEIERRLAYADETIAEGTRVTVVSQSGTRVKVIAD